MFVDLDYFFAQVEEVENPSVKHKPIIVCVFSGRGGDSGVVSSANYVARRYGVKAGMPIRTAKRILPDEAIILPIRLSHYSEVSRKIMNLLKSFGGVVRVESIDEAVMDVTAVVDGDFEKAVALAKEIKKKIFDETGLTCSIGIGPNRVIAKMAADASKPNGLKLVMPEEVADFLRNQPVEALPGIGSKSGKILTEKGVRNVGDLAKLELPELEKIFGFKRALYFYQASRGVLDEPVAEKPPPSQISKIITLKRNTRDIEEVMEALSAVVEDAMARLASSGYLASKLGLIVITTTLKTITRQTEIRLGTGLDENLRSIRKILAELLEEDGELYIRRVGVRFSELKKFSGQSSLNLFTES